MEVNLEEFISVKGINAQGNQLTKDKINQISLLDSLPYEAPKEIYADELEVVDEETLTNDLNDENSEEKLDKTTSSKDSGDDDLNVDEQGQAKLF
jgi:topoisomerase-4 subunit A